MYWLRILYVYFFGEIFIYKMSDYLRLKKIFFFLNIFFDFLNVLLFI